MTLPDFLVMWPYDEIMIEGHRISLYHVVNEYQQGKNLDELHEWYPSLERELIQKVLDFYHANKAEVDAYVAKVREELLAQQALYPRMDWEAMRRRLEEKKRATKGE